MNWNEYKAFVLSKASPGTLDTRETMLDAAIHGLIGETGELTDHFKKAKYHGHALDETYIKLELGDLWWYTALAAEAKLLNIEVSLPVIGVPWTTAGIQLAIPVGRLADGDWFLGTEYQRLVDTLAGIGRWFHWPVEDIITANVNKLNARYKDKFTTEESLNRVEGAPEAVHQATQELA